jgi:hypothetical protein
LYLELCPWDKDRLSEILLTLDNMTEDLGRLLCASE